MAGHKRGREVDVHAPLPNHLFANNATLRKRGKITGYFKPVLANAEKNRRNHTRAPKKARPVISRVHNLENINLEGGRRATRKKRGLRR